MSISSYPEVRFRFIFALTLCFLLPGVLSAQNTQAQKIASSADSVTFKPFPSTGITEAYNTTSNLIKEAGSKRISEDVYSSYREEADTLFANINDYLADSSKVKLKGMNIREMEQIQARVRSYNTKLEHLQEQLSKTAEGLEDAGKELADMEKRWEMTLEAKEETEMLDTREKRIELIIHHLDSVQAFLQVDLAGILVELDRVEEKELELASFIEQTLEAKAQLSERLFLQEMPGILKDLKNLNNPELFKPHLDKFQGNLKADIDIFRQDFRQPMIVLILLYVALLVLTFWYKENYARLLPGGDFKLSELHMVIISSPLATSTFLLALLVRFVLPDLPRTFLSLNVLVMLIPISVLLIRMIGPQVRSWIIVLSAVYILALMFELAYYPDVLLRVLLLVISAGGLWIFIWTFVNKPLVSGFKKGFIYYCFRVLILAFIVFLAIAIVANLAGSFGAAEYFSLIPIQIAILAVAVLVAIKVADALIYLLLSIKFVQSLHVVREEYVAIHNWILGLIELFFWLFFFTTAMRFFRVQDAVFDWARKVFTEGIPIGQVEITLLNILVFIFVLWLSILVTRVVTRILDKDVFPRVKVKKGVPNTVIMLLRLFLIVAGFFLAAAAAGMKLTNLSIVLGAFSVGIGFGLQNIFNNMVSGIILALERPIKVGDVVQVGQLVGIVRSISLRSSTVKSYDGSEVIVPNGNLISKEMINWTLSDNSRRMDIRIRATYGTDPDQVLQIMREVAFGHKEVNSKPNPMFLFDDFGDSALEFRLLAWVNIDNRLTVESELKLELNRRLKEAGIEIPLPQHDVNLRSVESGLSQPDPDKNGNIEGE